MTRVLFTLICLWTLPAIAQETLPPIVENPYADSADNISADMSMVTAGTDWELLGPTQEPDPSTTYNLYFYKLLQVNTASDRYASIIEVNVQGDPSSYQAQGTYNIRVEKFNGTAGRFDGLEIRCSSGNPAAATFYIYNNALWVRSNFKWGNIYYRSDADFGGASSPLNVAPFGKTITVPAGYDTLTTSGSIKCDFDANKYYPLPFVNVNGTQAFYNDVGLLVGSKIGIGLGDQFSYDNKTQPHYGYQWAQDSWSASGPTYWLSSYGGIKFFTSGSLKMVVDGAGNVGIGTADTKGYKLAVNGDALFTRVKVKSFAAWPDYVFQPEYQLSSLYEIEKYIKANKHLPGIPSAAEVEKEGLDLAEMNKRLLQKIEELTLHLIDMKKEIDQLKMQNNAATDQIN